MAYIGSGISKFNTADGLTVSGDADIDGAVDMASTLTLAGNADFNGNLDVDGTTDLDTTNVVGAFTVTGDVTLNDGSPNLRLKDTDTNRFVDLLYGTRVATIRNTMAAGEDIDTVEPSMVFSFQDDSETRTALTLDHDANVIAASKIGVGATPNTTFGSLLYVQGTPAANKPIISGYSTGNSNNAGIALFNDAGNRGIWTTGSTMRFTRTYEGNSTADVSIDASGNVGISETSPDAKLHITDSTDGGSTSVTSAIQFSRRSGGSNDAVIKMQHDGSDGVANLQLHLGASERMRITKDGDFSVSKVGFHVDGRNSNASNNASVFYGGTFLSVASYQDTTLLCNRMGNNGSIISFRQAANTVGTISVTGSATAYNTSSDYRLKTAVNYDWDATTRLKQLKPARFEWIADGDDAVPVDGFLAHEAQTVVPEAITGTKDEVEVWKDGEELPDDVSVGDNKLDDDGNTIPVMQGIDQSKLVPLLVKTIQELEARITALEAE